MRWSAALIGAGCTLMPALAFAEDPLPPLVIVEEGPATIPSTSEDTVYLRGGGMMRGKIRELVTGTQVTIALPTGDIRKVPWADVERVVIGDAPGPPAPPHVESAPVVAPPVTGPLARVHVESTKLVQLFRRPAGTPGWTHACHSPCDLDLPLGDEYRVSGSSMTTSSNFRLHGAPGEHITVTVNPTSTAGVAIGGVLAGVGGVVMYVVWVSASDLSRHVSAQGYTAIGVGVVAVALGAVIMLASVGTSASQTSAAKKDAYVREPSWLTPRVAASRATALPIFSREF